MSHIFSLFNSLFFYIFHIFSLFNLLFFHILHIFSLFNSLFFHIFPIFPLFNSLFFHIFHIFSLFNSLFFYIFQIFSLFKYCAVYSQYSEIYLNQSELSKTNITKIHNVCKTVAHLTCLIRAHVYHNNPIGFKPAFAVVPTDKICGQSISSDH